jgi:hypothetical protein
MTKQFLIAALAAGLIAFATEAWATPDCRVLVTLNHATGETLRRCTAANGESYCERCRSGQCTRTSCAQQAVPGTK